MSPRTLVTGVGGPAGGAVAGWLNSRGCGVVGADAEQVSVPGIETARLPLARDASYLSSLLELCRAGGIERVVPTVSEELPIVAGARQRFETAGVRVLIADPLPVSTADDKLLTARVLAGAGVHVPRFTRVGAIPDSEALAKVGFPMVTKPRVGRGGRGVAVHQGEAELLSRWPGSRAIAQEFMPGTEYAVQLSIGPREDVAVAMRKVSLREGAVGNAVAVERSADGDVEAVAISAAHALGLVGPVDVDVRRGPDSRPAVLELNARFGAWAAEAPEVLESVLEPDARLAGARP